jgi:adenylate kinase family enzyme
MASGNAVPVEVSYGLLAEALQYLPATDLILDGYPRVVDQVSCLARITGRAPYLVLVLIAPDEILIDRIRHRLSCLDCFAPFGPDLPGINGRCRWCGGALASREEDTREEAIVRRHVSWKRLGHPIIEYYAARLRVEHLRTDRPLDDLVAAAKAMIGA